MSSALTYEEFVEWARTSRDFMHYMESFRAISESAKGLDDDEDPALEVHTSAVSELRPTPNRGVMMIQKPKLKAYIQSICHSMNIK